MYRKTGERGTTKSRLRRWINSPSSINLMYLPALLLFVLFIYYPFFQGIMISFTNWDGYSQLYKYIGLDNYKRMLSDHRIGTVIVNTLIYGIGSTVYKMPLG